jgi:aromatic ring-cleaving dioxygenase
MLKASPTFHRGVNFVQISSLPYEQQSSFQDWIPKNSVLKMEIHNIAMDDCVDYQDYTYWFDFKFQQNSSIFEYSI